MRTHTPCQNPLPDKLYFKIGEVSEITGVPAYVLRFWETEFNSFKPKRTSSGRRLYRKKDVELVCRIKDLLYNKKYTIPGARLHLKKKDPPRDNQSLAVSSLKEELLKIRALLD